MGTPPAQGSGQKQMENSARSYDFFAKPLPSWADPYVPTPWPALKSESAGLSPLSCHPFALLESLPSNGVKGQV
jgi:hypothetical protein